jgi:hypothetical protein
LHDELGEMVSITDGNKTLEVTKQRAIVKALVRKSSQRRAACGCHHRECVRPDRRRSGDR